MSAITEALAFQVNTIDHSAGLSRPDWLVYQRFFEGVGGVGNFLLLRENAPALCKAMLEAYSLPTGDMPKESAE